MAMKKMMLSVSDDMLKALEGERRARKLETIPEAVRAVLGEYFKSKGQPLICWLVFPRHSSRTFHLSLEIEPIRTHVLLPTSLRAEASDSRFPHVP